MKKDFLWLTILLFLIACNEATKSSVEIITELKQQEIIFNNLLEVTQKGMSDSSINDSLGFLVLPVQASCPSCRKKTIDSIMKHQNDLAANRYIIVSANGGRKTIRGYFQEQAYELPNFKGHIFWDSTNQAKKLQLYENKPMMYYAWRKKAYKKVAAVPVTVREDLREFFSGQR